MEISIIIPVYNVEKFIERCIISILQQTYQDFEIIVVNDCTPDNSMCIVKKYASNDPRFVIVEHAENRGSLAARHSGLKNAHGKYIVFCDSDDMLPADSLELLHKAIDSQKSDIVIGGFNIEDGNRKFHYSCGSLRYGNTPEAVFKSFLKGELFFSLCGRIFRSELFLDCPLLVESKQSVGEDAMLFSYLVHKSSSVSILSHPVYNYMNNENSMTRTTFSEMQVKSLVLSGGFVQKVISNYPCLNFEWNKYTYKKLISLLYKHRVKYGLVYKSYTEYGREYMFDFGYQFSIFNLLAIPLFLLLKMKKMLDC